MRLFLFSFICLATASLQAAPATAVIHPAPDFSFMAEGGKTRTLRSLRGQSVVVIFSDSSKNKAFKKQLASLQGIYQQLASKQVVLVAVLSSSDGQMPTNMPVVIANNAPATAAAYGVQKGFQIAIIGRDGNLDYQTDKMVPAERVRDVVQNSFEVQSVARQTN